MAKPAPTKEELQKRLQEAQEARREVVAMRPKTRANAEAAERLVAENHLAERIRRAFT